jgi:hypothetical protein
MQITEQGASKSLLSNIYSRKCFGARPALGTILVWIVGLTFYGLCVAVVVWLAIEAAGEISRFLP